MLDAREIAAAAAVDNGFHDLRKNMLATDYELQIRMAYKARQTWYVVTVKRDGKKVAGPLRCQLWQQIFEKVRDALGESKSLPNL